MTTSTRTTHELQALRICTNNTIEPVTIDTTDTVTSIQTAIGCDYFDVVNLDHDIDLFVDDLGLLNGSPLNLVLTIIAHTLGKPVAIFGNAIALSCNPDTGDSISLTPEQQTRITSILTGIPDPEVITAVIDTLAPFPNVTAYLHTFL